MKTRTKHALEVWGAHRDPALAALIETLGRALPAAPPFTKTGSALQREVRGRIAADDPADVELLVATPLPRTWADLSSRLGALADRSPDPRIATYLHRLVAAPPTNRGTFWRELFQAIATVGDPRSLDRLRDFAPQLADVVGGSQASTQGRAL